MTPLYDERLLQVDRKYYDGEESDGEGKEGCNDCCDCSCVSCEKMFKSCERCRSKYFDTCCDKCDNCRCCERCKCKCCDKLECCEDWNFCCPNTTQQTGRWFQLFCMIMMIASGLIAITGRGLLSVLQGVFGIIFAIEGLTGFTTLRLDVVKRFRVMLFFYLCATIAIGIVNLLTIEQYCGNAEEKERESCETQAQISAYILLGIVPPTLVVFFCFVLRYIGQRDRSTTTRYRDHDGYRDHHQHHHHHRRQDKVEIGMAGSKKLHTKRRRTPVDDEHNAEYSTRRGDAMGSISMDTKHLGVNKGIRRSLGRQQSYGEGLFVPADELAGN
mmetsp:Transcript_24473/g.45782  ORF Transcript_24473/g.45782 Transcript_24473/m.45782 type:complete len:329 (-) Transcript_24473:208-1194(-)